MNAESPIAEILRESVRAAGSVRSISVASGVDRAVVSRFKSGERSIDLRTADRLARVLGLRLVRDDEEAGR